MEFNIDKKLKKFNKENDKRLREFTLNLMEEFENYFLKKEGTTFKEYLNNDGEDIYEMINEWRVKISKESGSILGTIADKIVENIKLTLHELNKAWKQGMTIREHEKIYPEPKEEQNEKIN